MEFTPAADPPQRPGIDRLRRARLLHDRTGRVVQVATPAAVVVVFAASLEADPRPGLTGTNLLVLGALSAFVLACGVALYGTAVRRLRLVAAALALLAALTLSFVQTAGVGMLGVGVAGCVLLGLVSPRLGRIAVPCAVVLVVATSLLHPPVFSRTFLSILAVGVVVVLITVAQRMRAAVDEAEHLLVATERSRRAEQEAAVLHERQQLAREMHDVLAHSLSGLALQLEGARLLAADRDTDPAVVAVIERAQTLTRSGLDEARRAIGLLRDDDLPGSDRLGDLVRTFTQDTGIPCALRVDGERRPLPATAELTLYRVTQEALTNVVRHADAGRVDVDLRYGPEHVRLRVADRPDGDAPGTRPATSPATVQAMPTVPAEPGGHGLTGMRERAALLGGTLTARPEDRGFVVELEVPA
ncbi:sensor histidine kinase [Promicromonospora sukumoe]